MALKRNSLIVGLTLLFVATSFLAIEIGIKIVPTKNPVALPQPAVNVPLDTCIDYSGDGPIYVYGNLPTDFDPGDRPVFIVDAVPRKPFPDVANFVNPRSPAPKYVAIVSNVGPDIESVEVKKSGGSGFLVCSTEDEKREVLSYRVRKPVEVNEVLLNSFDLGQFSVGSTIEIKQSCLPESKSYRAVYRGEDPTTTSIVTFNKKTDYCLHRNKTYLIIGYPSGDAEYFGG